MRIRIGGAWSFEPRPPSTMKPPSSKASIPIADRAPRFMISPVSMAPFELNPRVANRGADGERELGARAEAGVGGDGVRMSSL